MSLTITDVCGVRCLPGWTHRTFPVRRGDKPCTLGKFRLEIVYEHDAQPTTQWELVDYLGQGAYGQTYVMTRVGATIGETRAIKFVKPGDNEAIFLQSLPADMSLEPPFDIFDGIFTITPEWKKSLNKENAEMRGKFDKFQYIVVMKEIKNMELYDLIFNDNISKPFLSLPAIRKILRDLVDALAFMRKFKISHGDIKLENIMLDSCGKSVLLDFGGARFCEPGPTLQKIGVHTRIYLPPECACAGHGIINFDPEKSDVWALGVVIFRLFAKATPFLQDDSVGSHQNLEAFWQDFDNHSSSVHLRSMIDEYPEDFAEFKRFLTRMWSRDFRERPTFQEMRAACTHTASPQNVCRADVYDDLRWLRGDDRLEWKQFLEELVAQNPRIKVYTFSPQIWFTAQGGCDLFDDFCHFARIVCCTTVNAKGFSRQTLPSHQVADVAISVEDGTNIRKLNSDYFIFLFYCVLFYFLII